MQGERSTVCAVNERGQVEPCVGLDSAIEYDLRSGKGLRFHRLTNLTENDTKTGIVLNYCPFCGTDIGSHMGDLVPTDREQTDG